MAKRKRWEILYEDSSIIVISKPAPFLTIPDRYDQTIPSILGKLSDNRDEVYVNHRLDKETSGLLIFSKTEQAHRALSLDFVERRIDKYYYAITLGVPAEDVGLIDIPLMTSQGKGYKVVASSRGKACQTKYRVLKDYGKYAFVEIKLLTGRQHQIRVHMREIGCPIVCDKLYGDGNSFYLSDIKRKMSRSIDSEERPLLYRTALHAYKLQFTHPISKEALSFESPLPKDMKAVIYQMDKVFGTS